MALRVFLSTILLCSVVETSRASEESTGVESSVADSPALMRRGRPIESHGAAAGSEATAWLIPVATCPHCGYAPTVETSVYFFLVIGLIGQVGFSGRFIVQWWASERAHASVVPSSFWWLSIFGSVLLLIYAGSLAAWPIILGQSLNTLIYCRNLYFVRRTNSRVGTNTDEIIGHQRERQAGGCALPR